MSKADAAYQQGYTRGFQRGVEAALSLNGSLLVACKSAYTALLDAKDTYGFACNYELKLLDAAIKGAQELKGREV